MDPSFSTSPSPRRMCPMRRPRLLLPTVAHHPILTSKLLQYTFSSHLYVGPTSSQSTTDRLLFCTPLHKLSDPFAPLSPPFIRPVPSCRRPKQSKVSYVQTCNHPSKQFLCMGHFCRHFPFILRNLLHRHVHPHAQVRRIVLHPDQELELVHYVLQGSRTRR